MAAGMAAGGLRPYFAVYTSFFQRSHDQLIHDVCMQQLPVTFLLDRAGLVGEDGSTHHGIFDFAQVLPIPGLTVLAPKDIHELRQMIRWSATSDSPVVIRYGRQSIDLTPEYGSEETFVPGHWQKLNEGSDCTLLAVGSMVQVAIQTREYLSCHGINASVVNCSSLRPMDLETLKQLSSSPCITMEEHVLNGGFGSAVAEACRQEEIPSPVLTFGIPNTYVQHGRHDQLMKYLGLAPKQIAMRIIKYLEDRHE